MMFALFMIVILILTGTIWLLDNLFLAKKRNADEAEPVIVEYAKSFFPVILIVFVIRSFIVEPFKIPSGSMIPTLLVGDYILVNKYNYGLRVPILNNTFIEVDKPHRGDVFVFHYPPNPSIDYIKRVVGLPGDQIQYVDKQLTINGQLVDAESLGEYEYERRGLEIITADEFQETIGETTHHYLNIDIARGQYPHGSLGYRLANGETITVPEQSYFAMGDNRDDSADSRVWGFVPEKNLVGKAFYIWMNFGDLKNLFNGTGRIGTSIE